MCYATHHPRWKVPSKAESETKETGRGPPRTPPRMLVNLLFNPTSLSHNPLDNITAYPRPVFSCSTVCVNVSWPRTRQRRRKTKRSPFHFLRNKSESKARAECTGEPATMADAYSYALRVELEENNTPRLKNKLVKYFQSKKSNGGDCEVEYENGGRTAVLRFRSEEDQQHVLKKESHQISLDKGVLKMTVHLPTDVTTTQESPADELNKKSDVAVINKQPSTDDHTPAVEVQTKAQGGADETAGEELCSTSAVLGNIPETTNQEFLEMLVEKVLKDSPSASQSVTLEVIPDIYSAVVTFKSEKENTDFVTRCPQNRTFTKKGLSVRPLEATEQVVVEDIRHFSEDLLRLYFEYAGGDVENVVLNATEQSVIITFEDRKAVQKIMKKKHRIKEEEIKVYPFYKSLGTALYGKDRPPLKLPAAVSESVDDAVWRYLNDNQSAAETIQSQMAKDFCSVNLDQCAVCLSPLSSLLQEKDAKDLVKKWRDTVKSAFAQALSKFKSLKLQPESEAWEESEGKIRETLLNEDVVVVPQPASGVISVAGLVADVNRLEPTLCEVVNKIAKRVQREKSSETQLIKMSPSIHHILSQDGLKDKLLQVYPELKISFRKDSAGLEVTGFWDEISTASKVIFDAILALKRQNLEIDKYVLDSLKDAQQEELTNALLTSNGINVAFEINAHRVQLIAASDSDLSDAEDHLKRVLISQNIDVEDSNVLAKPEWQELVGQLEDADNNSCGRIQIHTAGQQVVVSGHKDSIKTVCSKLDDFLTQNAQVEETVVVRPNTTVDYIKKLDLSWLEPVEDRVVVSYRMEAICLSGSRVDVAECKALFENLVSSVVFETLKSSKPGVKKLFKDKADLYVSSLFVKTGCLVQLVDGTSGRRAFLAQRRAPKPVYQLQTADGVEIAICKADMCSYPVHAVVNASNPNLKHDGGLSKALLNAAGPQFQAESDKLVNLNGQLKPGDCVATGAGGQLCCKKVIHAVGPQYDSARPQKPLALLKRAIKGSLELAEKHGCVSVALPAVSSNQGFPLNVCAATIVKAVKEHCEDKYDDNTLRRIHLVNNDDSAVQAMEAAVRQEFGNHGVSLSPQTPLTKTTKSPLVTPAASDPICLGQVQTKEGLSVTLTKGNIENATTDVTVNILAEDLDLNRGAVSQAILREAGSKLQQSVNANHATGNIGEVIVTEGCKLKSKQVFHAVAPHWDSGKGTADKLLSGIFKDCLGKAEDNGLTSISFPAIGTGNLGFPKDLAASLMLDEILEFSSNKQPKHLKKVVIILYSQDAQTIQNFSDVFTKKFPTASVPTSSPQSQGPFTKVVSSAGMHETKMGSVALQVLTGDITKETSDVVVNSSNENFSLKSGVSKAILDEAGPAVEAECATLGAQPNPGMIITQPGNLKCKKILHLIGQTDPVKIKKGVKDSLQMCVTNSYTSVSFPAIGTGQGNVQAKQVADAMLDAVIDALSQNTPGPLKTIRIVIFQPPMLKDFYNSMHQREATDPKDKGGLWGNIGSKIKSLFVRGPSGDKPQREGDFVIEALKVDPASFHICGESQARVDLAKQQLDQLITQEQNSLCIPDNSILGFSDADHQRIVDIQKTMDVTIRTESKNAQASLTIDGLSKDVLRASHEIHAMLRSARDKDELKRRAEQSATVADWQYQQPGLQFMSFDLMANFKLEQALENKLASVKVTVLSHDYTVTMPKGPATDNQGQVLQIQRIDKLKDEDASEHWDKMPANTSSLAVLIKVGAAEHTEILNLFQATCNQTVIKIERIQNPILWKSLQIKKRDMEQRNNHQNNERRLFHGTSHDTVAHINEHGFNRSYAGKNAACYGNGTYFAVGAAYSAHDTYSKPNQSGEKCMYLCRVLTGDFTVGKQGMIAPPAKGGAVSIQIYDSVVDRLANPTMFVIFHDSQACPEYLITFK
ncbi:poly(ADP-ribose) polymerase family member 14-related sequence 1 isoform X2 [Anarrhichthys ocellatus]|uniref:poly(ADP-ribose) polymerase family member 14-related sequence 1 isoform X2 n=1 Tax=Anarrhichthys ocellatus TaxID=433405 RepID=UPI0012EDCD5C|nr:protein mono-ADP-ribosyltransferase PARP14 isoform X2 [Anarrhichthys ocellatus]